jgi:hypothetical protein
MAVIVPREEASLAAMTLESNIRLRLLLRQ